MKVTMETKKTAETEKALVLNLLAKKKLANDIFQTEYGNLLLIHINPENAFSFLSELQAIIEIESVYFRDNGCTVFTRHWLDIGVFFDR